MDDPEEHNPLTHTTEAEVEPTIKQTENLDGSGNDLSAIEKLQVSSEWENADDENVSPVRHKTRNLQISDNDSDEEESGKVEKDVIEEIGKTAVQNNYKLLIDSDTESESEPTGKIDGMDNGRTANNDGQEAESKKRTSPPPKQMSAKQAMEQMKSIKSETQRLTRENYVRIPYHKPKQYSLKEFMNRKTITKPNLKGNNKQLSLKMNQYELIEFAKQLNEREKEAADFFKSNSEEEAVKAEPIKIETIENSTEKKYEEDEVPSLEVNDIDTPDNKSKPGSELESSEPHENIEEDLKSNEFEALEMSENVVEPPKPTLSDNIKGLLKERDVISNPVLKGTPNMVIDLETGDVVSPKPSGVDQLFERFLKHSSKRKPKEQTSMSIVSTENGVLEITNVNVELTDNPSTEQKPGAAYFKLQDDLKKVMLKKRKEELRKRLLETNACDQENEEFDEISEKKMMMDEEDEFGNGETEELDENAEEDKLEDEKKEDEEKSDEEDEDVEADDEYDSDESDDDDELPEVTRKSKNRIITAFEDSDEEIIDNEKESLGSNLNATPVSGKYGISSLEPCDNSSANDNHGGLWNEENKPQEDNEDELLGLCSGQFNPTQKNLVISQIPNTQFRETADENELLALCSGTFRNTTQVADYESTENDGFVVNTLAALETSDEEDGAPPFSDQLQQKKKRKLSFTDDEESEAENLTNEEAAELINNPSEVDNVEESEQEEEIPATYIDYDSEENEIEVQMTKKDCKLKANEFVENEAELSESEWGSADEDEKDMDRYDIDLADEEEFDKEKLKDELGRIHMRHILDKDIREVKKIQDLFFEDEENDGVGRERQFRWKNMQEGFSLEVETEGNAEGKPESEDENELLWRKMRYERELLLKEKSTEVDKTNETTPVSELSTSVGKKLTILNINKSNTVIKEQSSPFLIANSVTSNRGSFLVRDNDTLAKLASITKSGFEQDNGIVMKGMGKAKNFVFATLSQTEPDNVLKRKSLNSGTDLEIRQNKKPKMNTNKKIRLIDHMA